MRKWEIKVDHKGRLQLPASFRREITLVPGERVRIVQRGKWLELQLPPPKEIGNIPLYGITVEGAEELASQGVAVEADGDRKLARLKVRR